MNYTEIEKLITVVEVRNINLTKEIIITIINYTG